jgi:hypothetical protein
MLASLAFRVRYCYFRDMTLATGQYSLAPHFSLILEQLREFVPEAAGRRLAIFRLPKVALCEGY